MASNDFDGGGRPPCSPPAELISTGETSVGGSFSRAYIRLIWQLTFSVVLRPRLLVLTALLKSSEVLSHFSDRMPSKLFVVFGTVFIIVFFELYHKAPLIIRENCLN